MQPELGMQLYDFHARQYDPQIGRFWGIDPLDQFPSGYTGMGNDPANNIDPSGMWTGTGDRRLLAWSVKRQQRAQDEYYAYLNTIIDFESHHFVRPPLMASDGPLYDETEEVVSFDQVQSVARSQYLDKLGHWDKLKQVVFVDGNGAIITPSGRFLPADLMDDYLKKQDAGLNDEKTIEGVVESGRNMVVANQSETANGTNSGEKTDVDNIIIANAQSGAQGMGHNAVLIGNDEHGYQFISKEGRDDKQSGNAVTGGPALPAIDKPYKNFQQFLDDPKREQYNRFVIIQGVPHNSAEMLKGVMRMEANSYYHILFNNCGQAVTNMLEYGSFPSFRATEPNNSFEMYKILSRYKNWIYYER